MAATIQDALDDFHKRESPRAKLKRWDSCWNGSYVKTLSSQYLLQVDILEAVLEADGVGKEVVDKMCELECAIEGVIYQQSIARRTFWLSLVSLTTSIAAFAVALLKNGGFKY